MTGVDALGLTILPDGCGERPEWVPADPPDPKTAGLTGDLTPTSQAAIDAALSDPPEPEPRWEPQPHAEPIASDEWEPAPEPVSDPEEVCPEFTHTGYCPDRLCGRGCKHEAAWKVGDRVEHTIHGIGEVIAYATHTTYRPYQVRFSGGGAYWFEAGDIQEAPPVSDTVMVSVPRDLMDRLAATTTVDDTIGLIDALLYVCRAALTDEGERP